MTRELYESQTVKYFRNDMNCVTQSQYKNMSTNDKRFMKNSDCKYVQ